MSTLPITLSAAAAAVGVLATGLHLEKRICATPEEHQQCEVCEAPVCPGCLTAPDSSACGHGAVVCERCDPGDVCGGCFREGRMAAVDRRVAGPALDVDDCQTCDGLGEYAPGRLDPWSGRVDVVTCPSCGGSGTWRRA